MAVSGKHSRLAATVSRSAITGWSRSCEPATHVWPLRSWIAAH
jgi:hypothetical protein